MARCGRGSASNRARSNPSGSWDCVPVLSRNAASCCTSGDRQPTTLSDYPANSLVRRSSGPASCAFGPRTDRSSRFKRRCSIRSVRIQRLRRASRMSTCRSMVASVAASQRGRPTISNQSRHTRASLVPIVDLAAAGWNIVLVHGNGPQVGDELARNEIAGDQVEPLPLGVLVAGTAGWMGYMIQQSLQNALARAGVQRSVVTLITQTLCDADDPNLRTPSKPIGHVLDTVRQARLVARGIAVKDGRRLAPSPKPIGIVEREMVRDLARTGHIVIAGGGGGPPVYRDPKLGLEGIDAVADKDRVAAILGREIEAQVLLILTNVDAVDHGFR